MIWESNHAWQKKPLFYYKKGKSYQPSISDDTLKTIVLFNNVGSRSHDVGKKSNRKGVQRNDKYFWKKVLEVHSLTATKFF